MTDQPEALRWDMGDESSPPYPHADGDWVRYEDYERLREEIKRLRGALKSIKTLKVTVDGVPAGAYQTEGWMRELAREALEVKP